MSLFHIFLFGMVAVAYAQVSMAPGYKEKYPQYYHLSKQARHPRDVSWDKQVGKGKVFGTLGTNDDGGLFVKARIDDFYAIMRKRLASLLSRLRDTTSTILSVFADNLSQVAASGSGIWNLDKNTKLSAGGTYQQEIGRGKPDLGVQAEIEHKF
ncbi:gloverin-like [Pectinophora gossypiella]|uniref:gloverin-like n=1 Tax=Pectinophora gossypiella TaxID=13191 RepID=UPI00214E3B12|nr:gloverin-like [Pectinophora gossypiella]